MSRIIFLQDPRVRIRQYLSIVAAVLVFIFSASQLGIDMNRFITRLPNAGRVLALMSVFDFSDIRTVLLEMLVSISIAVSSLAIGFLLSVVLAFLAADTITPHRLLSLIIKSLVAVVRAVPSLVWILMVVASMGFTNTAAIVGLIISTFGFLTKAFIASIEDLGTGNIEAMKSTGASWIQIVLKGLVPSLISPFLSWTAIRFESSISESISLGMLGVAGIGFVLIQASRNYRYERISVIVLVIVLTMILVESLVNQFRKRLQ